MGESHHLAVVQPAVSVLLPVYNGGEYLRLFLQSALRQTAVDFELLACDDGSTDGSAAVVEEFAADPRVRLLRNPQNLGLNPTWQRLLGEMKGAWWCCPGADDLWDDDFLERRLAVCANDPGIGLVHGAARIIDANGNPMKWPDYERQCGILESTGRVVKSEAMFRRLLEHNYIIQPTVLASAEATRAVKNHFRTNFRYTPDWYLWLLLARNGADFHFDPKPCVSYRVHGSSLSGNPGLDKTRRLEVRLAPLAALVLPGRCPKQWRHLRRGFQSLLLLRLLLGGKPARAHLKDELRACWGVRNPLGFAIRLTRAALGLPFWWIWLRFNAKRGDFRVSGIPTAS